MEIVDVEMCIMNRRLIDGIFVMRIFSKTFFSLFLIVLFTGGCNQTRPTVTQDSLIDYASENSIAIRHSTMFMAPPPSAQVIDIASSHCGKYRKGWKLVSSTPHSLLIPGLHTFMCTNDFADERIEIKVNN